MDRKIIAFVHINKGAGTTFTHILRLNYFLTHVDVKPICSKSRKYFDAEDMKKVIIFNPFLKSIAGHSIKPYSNIKEIFPGIRFVTLLRDPLQRTISHYQYSIEKHKKTISFDEYLKRSVSYNRQTKIIAGSYDLRLARDLISKNFFHVGIVEEFDEFLILLRRKLKPFDFKIGYKKENVAKKTSPIRKSINLKINQYEKNIIKQNLLDLELYDFVKKEIIPKQKDLYGKDFMKDLAKTKTANTGYFNKKKRYIDFFVRKIYYEPIFKILRKL